MNTYNDYDDDGNNIVPCPICLSVFCLSKEGEKCPEEDEFAKAHKSEQKEEWLEEWDKYSNGEIVDPVPFFRTQIALAEELGRREEMERHVKTLSALSSMWNQYCSNESGHEFMSAGEEASEVLSKYGLLKAMKGKMINGMFGNSEVDYPLSVEECEKFFLSTLTQKL